MPTFSVKAQETGATANGVLLRVKVLTGAALNQSGAATAAQNGAAAHQANIVTTQTGSVVYFAAWTATVASAFVANANSALFDSTVRPGDALTHGSGRATNPTGTPGSTSIGCSTPTNNGNISLLEVLAATTITEDASSPAVASALATSVSTAAFTPPYGSLLVAMVSTNGGAGITGVTMTDTSGLGLTWAAGSANNPSSLAFAGVFLAQMPGSPAVAPPPVPPGFSSPASFFFSWRSPQPPVIARSPVTGAAAASGVMAGGRVISDPLTAAAAASGSFSGVAGSPALIYYPRLAGPVVRPVSYASPSVQVPLAAYAAASGRAAAARTADGTLAGTSAVSGSMTGLKTADALLAGTSAASGIAQGFILGEGPATAGYAGASGVFASARTGTTSFAGFAAAALRSSPRSSRHGALAGYSAVAALLSGEAPPVVRKTGSWWGLDNVLKERAEYATYYRSQPPVACPNDGTPLLEGPPQAAAVLYCPFDGWQYPRDYDPDIHSGM